MRSPIRHALYRKLLLPSFSRPLMTSTREGYTIYILTLRTDPSHHNRLATLQDQYSSSNSSSPPAGLTLFHSLPASHLPQIEDDIHTLASSRHTFNISTGNAFVVRRHVALYARASPTKVIHSQLGAKWKEFLNSKDTSFKKPFYTISEEYKDDPSKAKAVMQEVKRDFEGSEGIAEGLSLWTIERGMWRVEKGLWRIEKGEWRHIRDFMFLPRRQTDDEMIQEDPEDILPPVRKKKRNRWQKS